MDYEFVHPGRTFQRLALGGGGRLDESLVLEHVAIPGTAVFARLVPLGELAAGVALIVGLWTPLAALLAFVMVLNIHVASGALFGYAFLTNGYGLPVLGSTLGLALGGIRLPLSLRR